ncbi:hypothetical protein GCM10011387_19960 [Pedobacter quisquiliarum]|uniref:CarboxypepD_reg-like domain-containing protein n=1 Tax=Pedobacter quisquiliarum TaxID=1834438 RepID=A0A916UAH5_9SPHI|nr:hypothetical protein [Pedobacter quisquiliarum]GGC66559.1 hypothetical protein GCM10011387_19960 [Pedobacter quisquiliarum]
MIKVLTLVMVLLFLWIGVDAQMLPGIIKDRSSNIKLEDVSVSNQNTGASTQTNKEGAFKIAASLNQILIFYKPGYKPDTLLITDMKPMIRYFIIENKLLNTVEIKGEAFNPEVQYADVYRKAKVISADQNKPFTFYPSKFFSKDRFARRFKKRLEQEKLERKIDIRFNDRVVKTMTPLTGKELDCFMVRYRPTLKALNKLDQDDLMIYIMNSYKAFKLLPASERVLPSLQGSQPLPANLGL